MQSLVKVEHTSIAGVLILTPKVFGDDRGFFFESFTANIFSETVGAEVAFVQDNHSKSQKNVLRGLHMQTRKPQGKLIRVISGNIFDVVVDLRSDSPTFRHWVGINLSAANKSQLWVPEGLAHGFLTTSEDTEVLYKVTDLYDPGFEISIAWDEPTVGIEWPIQESPTLSSKDAQGLSVDEALEKLRLPKI